MTRPSEGLLAPTLEEQLAQFCRHYRAARQWALTNVVGVSLTHHAVVGVWSTVIGDLEALLPPDARPGGPDGPHPAER